MLDILAPEPGSFTIMDRGFLDFARNNFDLPALTIAQLYKCRWQVELFFKWIKQHQGFFRHLGKCRQNELRVSAALADAETRLD